MAIEIKLLKESDKERNVIYHREFCDRQVGQLSSWNENYVFVRFKGPGGEACEPDDVSFEHPDPPVKACTLDDLGMSITGEEAAPLIESINAYLANFVAGGKCPKCGAKLGGLLGSFTWGLAFGEGHCTGGLTGTKCGWPCRGVHAINGADGEPIFEQSLPIVLAYHPNAVKLEPKEADSHA